MALRKQAFDLGVVVADAERSLAFYRDAIGLEPSGTTPIPGGTMHRFAAGASTLKLLALDAGARRSEEPGAFAGVTGFRYLTLWFDDPSVVLERCREAGHRVLRELSEIRPGVRIAFVEDPDGNWVELGGADGDLP